MKPFSTSYARRAFLKYSVLSASAVVLGGHLLSLGQKVWAEVAQTLKLVDMTKKLRKDPENEAAVAQLTGMGYFADAKKAEKAKKLKREDKASPSGKTFAAKFQYCRSCALMEDAYLNTKGPVGKCKIVAGVLINSEGYCNTYSVHPNAQEKV